jgi:uncharacterized protein YaiI (UPF0178 family)
MIVTGRTENRRPCVILFSMTIRIYIDADACPVKDETYKVAIRYGLETFVISNSFMQVPTSPLITRIIVDAGADVADDWIVEHVAAGDIVVTGDIPLAARILAKEAHAIGPYGRAFTEDSIGLALAQRSLMEHIRLSGETTGGPPPFSSANRSRFLQALDLAIAREKRKRSLSERR